MITYINKVRNRQDGKREYGSADMIAALTLTPIILALFFAIIDVSIWLNTKSHIEAATRDGVRMAAMWGGTSTGARLNTTGKSTSTLIVDKMYNREGKSCTRSNCTKAPVVNCYVGSKGKYVATAANQTVRCDVTYYYKSIFPGAKLMGFGAITEKPISYSMTAVTETGYR